MSPEELIDAAVLRITEAALNLFVADQHRFSTRPCGTCRTITRLIRKPWGCEKLAGRPYDGA